MRAPWHILLSVLAWCSGETWGQIPFLATRENTQTSCAARGLGGDVLLRPAGVFADPRIDITYYKLDLILQIPLAQINGKVTIRATSIVDSLRTVTLDLSTTMHVDSVRNGTARFTVVQTFFGITISLDRVYTRNELLSFDVYYRGAPSGGTGFGSFRFASQEGIPWVWTLSEPYGARDWWPCKDNTTDKADSVDVWITCPSNLKAGSNGRLTGVRDNGNGTSTYQWSERYPIAAYLVSLAVTNYAVFTNWFRYSPTDSMPILNYVLPQDLATVQPELLKVPEMLRIFSAKYGLYPFINEKYGHSQFGWGGAMEHQTMTSITAFEELTIAHELAHQWFGDLITCANWPSIWLNEGFAVYSESVYLENRYSFGDYRVHMTELKSRAMSAVGTIYVADTSTTASIFNYNRTYAKGAWVLHMLRHVLGDSVFFRAMRAYTDDPRFRYKSATTEGFRDVCETVSGKSLGYFFDEWVFGEGFPRYRLEWTTVKRGGEYDVSVRIEQSTGGTNPSFFRMPVDLLFTRDNGIDTTVTVNPAAAVETFSFTFSSAPTDVRLDPDEWILREILPPEEPIPGAFELRQNYPNPFNAGTSITFALPHRSIVQVSIYDLLGREVKVLAREQREAGTHTVQWDGRDAAGRIAASGVYFYRLSTDAFTSVKAMRLLR